MLQCVIESVTRITQVKSGAMLLNFDRDIVNIILELMHVIVIKCWMIKLFKTISFLQYHEKSINEMYFASPLWFRFMFSKWQLLCKFGIMERNFLYISCFCSCFSPLPTLCPLFSSLFLLWNTFLFWIFGTTVFHRCNLASFVLHEPMLSNYQWGLEACTCWGGFRRKCTRCLSLLWI